VQKQNKNKNKTKAKTKQKQKQSVDAIPLAGHTQHIHTHTPTLLRGGVFFQPVPHFGIRRTTAPLECYLERIAA
jgi:hypothetical protein